MNNVKIIRAGWLVDGSGGPIQENIQLTVVDGLIESIGQAPPTGFSHPDFLKTKSSDLTTCTILPSLVDSHVHLSMSGTDDQNRRIQQLTADFSETKGTINDHVRQHLHAGVLAVRDGGDKMGHALRFRLNFLASCGTPLQVKAAGRAWHQEGRYGRLIGRAFRSHHHFLKTITQEAGDIDHIKIVHSGLNSLTEFGKETLPQFEIGDLKKMVAAARQHNLKTMVHANGRKPVQTAIAAGCDAIEHGFFMGNDNLAALADKAIFWVPTAVTMKAYCRYMKQIGKTANIARRNLAHQLEQLAKAREYGIPIAIGTDAGSPGVDHGVAVVDEMKLFMEAGYSLTETVRCGTSNGAKLLGIPNMGLLAARMPATFIAVKGDPDGLPDNLKEIEALYIKGELYQASFKP